MGMSELWSQEGTFERALYMLRKYGRLHTTSTTSIGTFKICLHLVCPCPLKLLLVLVRFLVFLSCTVSLSLLSHRRGSHEARLFSRCHPGPVAHATDRERCTDVDCLGVSTYHSYVARFLRQICGFGSALQLWESESQILCLVLKIHKLLKTRLTCVSARFQLCLWQKWKTAIPNCFGIPKNSSEIRSIDPWISYQRRVAANQAVVLGPPGLQCWQR